MSLYTSIKKGLTPDECKELIEYIQKNNSWENMHDLYLQYKERKCYRRIIKYYSLRFDTRTGDMWCISFGVTNPIVFTMGSNHDEFKKTIYNYLDEEIPFSDDNDVYKKVTDTHTEVNDFIEKFHIPDEDITTVFTQGCCYWFSHILKERFKDVAEIKYNPIEGHFATEIYGILYDIKGRLTVIDQHQWYSWDRYPDIKEKERIERDCIKITERND